MLTAGIILSALVLGQPKATPASDTDPRCGGFCLYVSLKSLDLAPASYAELEHGLGRPPPAGYSMQQLEDYARRRGAATLAVETSLANLGQRERPFACIAFVEPDHFLIVSDVDDRLVHVLDPPTTNAVPLDTFNATWSRKVLLLGRSPLSIEATIGSSGRGRRWLGWLVGAALALMLAIFMASRRRRTAVAACWVGLSVVASGCTPARTEPTQAAPTPSSRDLQPRLVFQPERHDLGTIFTSTPAQTRVIRTVIRNDGDRTATILGVAPSCPCTTESLTARKVAPHSSTELTLSVRLGDSPEPRRTIIRVNSDDPHRPDVPITVDWQVRPALSTDPGSLQWGDVQPGERRETNMAIYAAGLGLCSRCELAVLTDRAEVSHRVELNPTARTTHDDPTGSGQSRQQIGTLRVQLRSQFEATTAQTSLDLLLKCQDEVRGRLAVPLSWAVRPLLEISPTRLSVGVRPANTPVVSKIFIRSTRGSRFSVHQVGDESDRVKLSGNSTSESRTMHGLTLEIRTPPTHGPWSTRLILGTDLAGAETLVLPISGYTPD